jgi:hypothetical protein
MISESEKDVCITDSELQGQIDSNEIQFEGASTNSEMECQNKSQKYILTFGFQIVEAFTA